MLIEKRKRGRKRLRVVSRGFLLQFHPRSQISCNGKLDYSLLLNVLPVLLCNIFTVFRTFYVILFVSIREGGCHNHHQDEGDQRKALWMMHGPITLNTGHATACITSFIIFKKHNKNSRVILYGKPGLGETTLT